MKECYEYLQDDTNIGESSAEERVMMQKVAHFFLCNTHALVLKHREGALLFHIHKVIFSSDEVVVSDMAATAIHIVEMLEQTTPRQAGYKRALALVPSRQINLI